ncbi:hypothetical protein NON00_13525 [Roseomonas sp. GC11]|uniref:hypothetical protein n=1 Tax=Roseomonas sp. GC11 TaxID=2950546 RepID=UPI00210C2AF7|nr:hypothetical protein [Roseomonas sp. GC11]MCQ4160949.1 hypothetical protein [Roseomonas sp. GC11]
MRRYLTPLMVAAVAGVAPGLFALAQLALAHPAASPMAVSPPVSLAVSGQVLHRVALSQGLADAPGCAESAPLFRSAMPRLVGWQPVSGKQTVEGKATPSPAPAPPAPAFAMHQALHLCVVDRFSPSRPLGGAARAVHRL